MTQSELAKRIDHTLLAPDATLADIDRVVNEALEFGFASVCVAPVFVKHVSKRLAGSDVRTCSVIGFPHGTHKPTLKAIEATAAVKDGADELDVVAHLPNLQAMDVPAAQAELSEIVRGARAVRRDVVVKVIIESALLLQRLGDRGEQAIAAACRAIQQSGCDFVKTSTGFHPSGGATLEAVRLMRQHADALQVKAAGGIRDRATAIAMLEAGADRLGLSASVQIVGSGQ